jgi:hypothetical protein
MSVNQMKRRLGWPAKPKKPKRLGSHSTLPPVDWKPKKEKR